MNLSPDPVFGPGRQIRLHCRLGLAGGGTAFSTVEDEPLAFTFGDGTLQPALESLVRGLAAGAKASIHIGPGEVWGLPDAQLIQVLDAADCPPGFSPEAGQYLAFELPNGQETSGRILEAVDGGWRIDFNHPLAGQALVFEVDVLDVK